ncbi:MAG: hypothetical protein C4575_13155 [Desulforudis sp.]|nr:MAG: hypothetical protein C4575_13155 [Desulforudis sp.]
MLDRLIELSRTDYSNASIYAYIASVDDGETTIDGLVRLYKRKGFGVERIGVDEAQGEFRHSKN